MVAGRVTKGVWGVHGGLEGVKGVRGGLLDPFRSFLPLWKSCTAPDLVPNTTLWCNWPMFTGQVSLTHFLHIGVFLGASKRPLYEQTKSFRYPEKSQNSVY